MIARSSHARSDHLIQREVIFGIVKAADVKPKAVFAR
jgi:hypothetical protein